MTDFRDLKIDLVYETSTSDINNKLVIPLLSNSKLYRRGVGYFSASWIQLVSKGLLKIVENDGKIQLITSPKMSDEVREAFHSYRINYEGFDKTFRLIKTKS